MHLLASALEMPINRRPSRPMAAKLDVRGASGSARWAALFAVLLICARFETAGLWAIVTPHACSAFFCQRRGRPGDKQFNRRWKPRQQYRTMRKPRKILPLFSKATSFWLAVFLITSTQHALPQQCPPNAHPAAVAVPGNLRTAQCFCDVGYTNVAGACVRAVTNPTDRPPPSDPNRMLVPPRPFR